MNKNINEIINQINDAVEKLGEIKDITVRTNESMSFDVDNITVRTSSGVISLKETSSLVGYICNNYDKFKSVTLSNTKKAVVITKI